MLTQLHKLSIAADGRYLRDDEMQFMEAYLASFDLRLSAYQKIQDAEPQIIRDVEMKMRSLDPYLLMRGVEDFSNKWKADTVRVLRLSALAMLLDDEERYKERFLYWFQTLMRAFRTQRSCEATYRFLQEVMANYLTHDELNLIKPILETNRSLLGLN
ncbi:MAG: phycobilisome protein [Cyanobacteriota bacterium]